MRIHFVPLINLRLCIRFISNKFNICGETNLVLILAYLYAATVKASLEKKPGKKERTSLYPETSNNT